MSDTWNADRFAARVASFCCIVLMAGVAFTYQPCPDPLRLGLTYNQVKAGPCPDIAIQASDTLQGDPGDEPGLYPIYQCPSQKVMVVGSRRTGEVVGLIKWR